MKINQIVVNESMGGVTAGAVASIAKPLGEVQKRVPVQKTTKKKGPYANSLSEGKKVDEAKLDEEDKIIAPGKGSRLKPGLLNKPEISVNPTDSVKIDVPLLIRLLEYAREDANSDLDLHDLAEKLVDRGRRGKTLSMKDYEFVVDECATTAGVIAGGGVGEGLGDKIKKGIKNIKRGLQGWDKNAVGPGGEKLGDPRDIVRRNKAHDDETVRQLAKDKELGFPFGGDSTTGKHSPRGLQKRVLDREMKKRGIAREGAKVDRMVQHIEKSEIKAGKSKDKAEDIAWATVNKRGYLNNKNKKKHTK